MTTEDFLAKIAWEGGVQAAIDYGLTAADADDPEIGRIWQHIIDVAPQAMDVEGLIDELHAAGDRG